MIWWGGKPSPGLTLDCTEGKFFCWIDNFSRVTISPIISILYFNIGIISVVLWSVVGAETPTISKQFFAILLHLVVSLNEFSLNLTEKFKTFAVLCMHNTIVPLCTLIEWVIKCLVDKILFHFHKDLMFYFVSPREVVCASICPCLTLQRYT